MTLIVNPVWIWDVNVYRKKIVHLKIDKIPYFDSKYPNPGENTVYEIYEN